MSWDPLAGHIRFTLEPELQTLLEFVPPGSRVLDFGCGYGRVSAQLAARRFVVTGYDASPQMITRGLRENPGLDLRVTDGEIPEPGASFDAVVCIGLLTSSPSSADRASIHAQISRLAKHGAVIYFAEFLQGNDRQYDQDGTFDLLPGIRLKHFQPVELQAEFARYEPLHCHVVIGRTLSGSSAHVMHFFGRVRRPTTH